ncbi:GNAT family N-acetyltransferase [Anaerocolumna sedimenticola]|uniref:GNAT family N-acetyltransferase n=1 Tax=Anaerocolumna sedimenticola TaxID=2696063 RepID=A0A6P1TJ83_9FIRM|nr:GNAT family N-acetyltransferase [Anaerocolumna sedimenticola]QHQ59695.1 GNAT family N-acetyltransferase [Anaerocolumna sedimenticola]
MNHTIYRKSTIQDLEKVSHQIQVSYKAAYNGLMDEQYLSSLQKDYWVPILQEAVSAGSVCIVAQNQDEIIGSVVFGRTTTEPDTDTAELFSIYLLPEYVGCGIGQKLYSEAEKRMVEQGFKICFLEVLSENTRAIRFYLTHGFKEIKKFTVTENGMILNCLAMKKDLQI